MAEIYYFDAWNGINLLPTNVQFAIYSALKIYRQIGINILNSSHYPNRSFVNLRQKMKLIYNIKSVPNFYIDSVEIKNKSMEMLSYTLKCMEETK